MSSLQQYWRDCLNHIRWISIFAVLINVSFIFWNRKYIRNNILEKQLIELDYDGITILKKEIGNS